ncbi:MAG: hypothetical protein ACXVY9_05585 [Terriglobales bacterium]
MTLRDSSSFQYGRKLLDSGLEGARTGEQMFLHGEPLAPYLNHSARHAVAPALIGACVGVIGSHGVRRRHSAAQAVAYGLVGCALGFGVALVWASRRLAASVVFGARKRISRVRDEHWLEHHPIDYA